MRESSSRSVLWLVFAIVFLDVAGFSIIFPLFPSMLEYYVWLEGSESMVGRLTEWLSGFAGEDENAVVTLFGGVLGSLYAAMQFVFSTIWGGLSDRIGRRATLLVTVAGTALAYLMWGFAGSFAVLVVARLFGGAMAGNIATAAAAAADISSGRDRAKAMGIVGMAIGLGFVLGPAIGGLVSADALNLYELWPAGREWGVNPFSTPAFVAMVLSLLNLIWVARRFPETLPPERRGQGQGAHTLRPFKRIATLNFPGVARAHLVSFIYVTAFAGMEFSLTFLAAERLDYGIADIAWTFVYTGFVIAAVQGGLVRRVVPRFGERPVARTGLIVLIPGFVLIGTTTSSVQLYAGMTLLAVGSGLAMPSLSALVSRYVPADRQGLAQGTLRSLGSLSRAIGPILGALLYWRFGSAVPYFSGAVLLLWPIALTMGLPPVPDHPE